MRNYLNAIVSDKCFYLNGKPKISQVRGLRNVLEANFANIYIVTDINTLFDEEIRNCLDSERYKILPIKYSSGLLNHEALCQKENVIFTSDMREYLLYRQYGEVIRLNFTPVSRKDWLNLANLTSSEISCKVSDELRFKLVERLAKEDVWNTFDGKFAF